MHAQAAAATDIAPLARQESEDPPTADVLDQLRHILFSPVFRRSERLSRFLRFVVEEKVAGRTHELKEYTIATEVYERATSFNPATDTIVRVEARRLRASLQRYYVDEGRFARVWIDVPKGGYEPVFRWRSSLPPTIEAGAELSSVAVLPFENLGGDQDQTGFCDGVTDEIMSALAQVEGLRVAARTSTFAFKSRHEDIRNIGKALNVGSVVEGTVQSAGGRARITAQLINISNGYNLWTHRFDIEMKDVFAIQDEVADAVVEVFRAQLQAKRTPAQ